MLRNSFYTVASGSGGNGYVVSAGDDMLIFEAGVRAKDMLAAVGFDVSRICGVLISHRHGDHAKYIGDWRGYAVPVYSNRDVAGVRVLAPKRRYQIGAFEVVTLPVPHGDTLNYAYLVRHEEIGTLLFATDLTTWPYDVRGVNHLCIECNYSEDIIIDAMTEGADVHSGNGNHLELSRCVAAVSCLQWPGLRTVTLLHLSDGFGDEAAFVSRVREVAGYAYVSAAAPGREVDLSLTDF